MDKLKLSATALGRLDAALERLESDEQLGPIEFEALLGEILQPLLGQEGFSLKHTCGARDSGMDFHAVRSMGDIKSDGETLGIEAKFFRKPRRLVPLNVVRDLIGAGVRKGFERVMLVSNGDFSSRMREEISRDRPLTVELLGISDLKSWVTRLRTEKPDIESEVRMILRDVSQTLIQHIAENIATLDHLEWRDVERLVAEVFSGLGFDVELTPGSKDGGKDVILTCTVNGMKAQYFVEVKHWRSANRVGAAAIKQLLKVIVREKAEGGLFLSSYGFTENAFEQLTILDREKVHIGDKDRIVSLCKSWVKVRAGLWSPPKNLSQVLFDN